MADQPPAILDLEGRQALLGQQGVQRADQVPHRVHQSAVEIEDDGGAVQTHHPTHAIAGPFG